jgi:thioredoxin reductase (NADPH)
LTAHVYDIRHFQNLKNQYNVMSVPCMVVNDQSVFFGKKTIQQVLELIM